MGTYLRSTLSIMRGVDFVPNAKIVAKQFGQLHKIEVEANDGN